MAICIIVEVRVGLQFAIFNNDTNITMMLIKSSLLCHSEAFNYGRTDDRTERNGHKKLSNFIRGVYTCWLSKKSADKSDNLLDLFSISLSDLNEINLSGLIFLSRRLHWPEVYIHLTNTERHEIIIGHVDFIGINTPDYYSAIWNNK
jgi:hypothetical protein